jgi:hypothetical protein
MIVVSDTSPLTALLTVGSAELLVQLFGDDLKESALKSVGE